MSEDRQQPVDDPAAEAEHSPVGGERLAEARREKKITVVEIAKELHIDEAKVRALERNEFDALGAPVFAKGHMRKYAELVDVDSADVLAEYYRLTRAQGMPPIVSGRPRMHRELSPGPWIAVVIVLVAVAAAYWWFGVREPLPPAPQPETADTALDQAVATDPDVAAADGGETTVTEVPEQPTVEPGEEQGEADPLPAAEPPPPAATDTALDAGQMRLSLSFSGDCWTEITDASGRRLFFAMGRDGQTVDLAGAAPVSVLFGNRSNVNLVVDGESYALPASTRPDQPVRLTLVSAR